MRVRLLVGITGTRNGVDWPRIGESIDLPDVEAADLVTAGLAEPEPVAEPVPAPRKARK